MYKIGPFQYTFKPNPESKIVPKKIFCQKEITILENEFVIISGPSGAGKSSLLQILKGLIPEFGNGKFEGDVLYKENPLTGDFFQQNLKHIVFLFQNPFSQLLYPRAQEEFFFSMENYNFTTEQMDQKKEELQSYFDLKSLWNKKTSELSNGECQRLVLASLLAIDPKVLLLDEPTAFLDPLARQAFYQWLVLQKKEKRTIVLVDHHLDEVLLFADKIIWIDLNGEVTVQKPIGRETQNDESLPRIDVKKTKIELKISKLSFNYPDQDVLLENINLNAKSGEIIVFRGKNGKGKSTLFKLITGILKPLTGLVQISKNNQDLKLKNNYREIGYVFQNPESHFIYDTIQEELKGIEKHSLNDWVKFLFNGIDLARSPFLLSEGEKRRLSILMTVLQDKNIILFDEPTFGQDQESIALIRAMIMQLKDMGKIQILISHDETFIKSLNATEYELENRTLESRND